MRCGGLRTGIFVAVFFFVVAGDVGTRRDEQGYGKQDKSFHGLEIQYKKCDGSGEGYRPYAIENIAEGLLALDIVQVLLVFAFVFRSLVPDAGRLGVEYDAQDDACACERCRRDVAHLGPVGRILLPRPSSVQPVLGPAVECRPAVKGFVRVLGVENRGIDIERIQVDQQRARFGIVPFVPVAEYLGTVEHVETLRLARRDQVHALGRLVQLVHDVFRTGQDVVYGIEPVGEQRGEFRAALPMDNLVAGLDPAPCPFHHVLGKVLVPFHVVMVGDVELVAGKGFRREGSVQDNQLFLGDGDTQQGVRTGVNLFFALVHLGFYGNGVQSRFARNLQVLGLEFRQVDRIEVTAGRIQFLRQVDGGAPVVHLCDFAGLFQQRIDSGVRGNILLEGFQVSLEGVDVCLVTIVYRDDLVGESLAGKRKQD